MGSYEIFASSSEVNAQTIVELKTPSPLRSSTSSGSSSLLTGINEFTSSELIHRVGNHKYVSSGEEAGDEEFSEDKQSSVTRKGSRNTKNEESTSNSNKSSIQSSPSSLKRRLRASSSPSEALKLADHVASLDRRIRHERDVYLQLHDLNEKIEEKDEAEASSVICTSSRPSLLSESPRPRLEDNLTQKRINMCSSAPETMRVEKQNFEQRLHDFTRDLKKPVSRNFDERRPPKYLLPLKPQSREILRSNAPPLCLTDQKIVELLRRGSMSAREEYLKKTNNPPQRVAGLRQPTGVIIKNLSSGSEDDNCNKEWIIRKALDPNVTKFDNEANLKIGMEKLMKDETSAGPEVIQHQRPKYDSQVENHQENEIFEQTRSGKLILKSSSSRMTEIIEDIDASDHSHSSRSAQSMQKSLQSSMAELKSVLNNIDLKSRNSRPLVVPKLEIQSQEYSQSTSITSREDSTKRPLDMNALIRALSDVSVKQHQLGDRIIKKNCDNVTSESEWPRSSRYTSAANGSRQSIVSMENVAKQEKNLHCFQPQNCSRDSIIITAKYNEGNTTSRSKIPIVVGETHDNVVPKTNHIESRRKSERKITAVDTDVSKQERSPKIIDSKISSTGVTSKSQSVNSVNCGKLSIKPTKLYSPPMKKSQQLRTSRTDTYFPEGNISRLTKSLRSADCLLENNRKHEKNYTKANNGPGRVFSEPGSSRNAQKIIEDQSSSPPSSISRKIIPGIFKDQPRSSDEKYRYLRRGNRISYVSTSSGSSPIEIEGSGLQQTIVKSPSSHFRNEELKIKEKNENYEDRGEISPLSQRTFVTDEAENLSSRIVKSCREIHDFRTKSPDANEKIEREDLKLNSSPGNYVHENRISEDIHSRESAQSKNLFRTDSPLIFNRGKFKIYEDMVEASPRRQFSLPPDEASNLSTRSLKTCREKHKIRSKSSPRDSNQQNQIIEDRHSPESAESNTLFQPGFPSDSNRGKFKIYEDMVEESPRQLTLTTDEASNMSSRRSTLKSCREMHKMISKSPNSNVLPERKNFELNSSPEENSIHQNPTKENIHLQESSEPKNPFWADSSSELNRAMGSSFESNQATTSETHSCLTTPRNDVTIKKSSCSSRKSSLKKSLSKSSSASGSTDLPGHRYDENTRTVFRNLAAYAFDHFVTDTKRKSEEENIFPASSIVKRLSYSEVKDEPNVSEKSPGCTSDFQEPAQVSSTEELVDNCGLNSSQTNLALTGRSDGAVHLFRKAFDRATTRMKVSSSLSKLTRSPEDLRKESSNRAAGRRSQDRFPFTISENISGKSSSKCKAEQAVQMAPNSKSVEPSETAYRLTAHPSLLRLASTGIEPTAAEIIEAASHDPNIRNPCRKVPRRHRFLGFSWGRSRKKENEREIKTTKILYRNNRCQGDSADGSSVSTNFSVEKPGRQFNRDGLWVQGLREGNSGVDEDKENNFGEKEIAADKEQHFEEDRLSIFLAKTESLGPRQFIAQALENNRPINSPMFDEDPDVEADLGCLCARFCLFLIGGNVHSHHRSSFPHRNRRSIIRKKC